MGVRWDIEADEVAPPTAPARRAEPRAPGTNPPPDFESPARRRLARRRLLLTTVAALALVSTAYLGWRYWQGQRLLDRIREDVRAAVELEERALEAADAELYLRQQSRTRARLLRQQLGLGDERFRRQPPLPGLTPRSEPAVIRAIEPEADIPRGQPIRRATVELLSQHADPLGVATFLEARPYVLSNRGRWIHTTHPEASSEAEPLVWRGRRLELRYLPADGELLPPLLERVERDLSRFCTAADACHLPLTSGDRQGQIVRLSLTGAIPGRGGNLRIDGQTYLELPAPSLTLQPADRAAEALLIRQILRLAIASLVERRAGGGLDLVDGFGRPAEGLAQHESLLLALVDAWIASQQGLAPPTPDPWPANAYALLLPQLWTEREFRPSQQEVARWRPVLRHLAAHLAGELSPDALASLILELPTSTSLEGWLEAGVGPESGALLAAWRIEGPAFPADRHLLLGCWVGDWQLLLLEPGSRALRDLGSERCAPDAALDAAWHPGGQQLALLCGALPSQPEQIGAGPEARLELLSLPASTRTEARSKANDGESSAAAPIASPAAIPAGGEALWPRGPHWTSDGRWLLWTSLAEDDDARVWAWPAGTGGARPGPAPRLVGRARWAEVGPSDPAVAPAQRDPLRPSPAGTAVAFEIPGGRVAVYELDASGPRQRWTAPGSDPVWSPDGNHLALLRFDPTRPLARPELVLLDAATGAERATAALDLPALAAEAAAALAVDDPSAVAERWRVRLRVGAWSPDGARASLMATIRIERGAPLFGRAAQPAPYDWVAGLALDLRSGRAAQARTPAEAYIDARDRPALWVDDGRSLLLLHLEPSLWPIFLGAPDGGSPRPVASLLEPDTAALRSLTPAALEARLGAAWPELLRATGNRSPDGRWLAQTGFQPDRGSGSPDLRDTALELLAPDEDTPRWTLPMAYCARIAWQP